ncbi:proline-rich transmembrane protein 1-like [Tubulanus polymorphus]|uniref:proline-rich transmembrane protein 1-like n=1 Tax=Tubulanus polymorphus TaxID=672921 RepID=UPI003DA5A8E9
MAQPAKGEAYVVGQPPAQYPGQPPAQYPGQPYPQQPQGTYYGHPAGQGITTVIVGQGPLQNPPPDHLVWSIMMIICCCWPLAIPATIKSCDVRDAVAAGDLPRAQTASKSSRCWNIAALVAGICAHLIWIIYVIVIYTVYAHTLYNRAG